MKVLIIEDEAPAYRRLNTLLTKNHPDMEVVEVIDSVSEAVKWLRNHSAPSLIFSDIQLADGLSFEIYKAVEVSCPIIFTTAYDEYMMDAFETNGIDYLLKPIEETSLNRSISKFRKLTEGDRVDENPINNLLEVLEKKDRKYKKRFLVKVGSKLVPVVTDDLAYFQSSDGSTEMVLKTGKRFIVDQTLDELDSVLDPIEFFRLNRQFLANISSIDSIHQYFKGKLKIYLKPDAESEVIVSREKARSFKNWLDGDVEMD
jgi:DNA-binding LytR/AlgR family response regulator